MATYKGIQGYSVQKLSSDPTASESVGQLWYNSASGKFKIGTEGAGAWASGTSMNTIKNGTGGAGTTTAGLMAGGYDAPGTQGTTTEIWNGSTWTEVNNMVSARGSFGMTGTSTAAITAGGNLVPGSYVSVSETWDGTSWTEGNNILTARRTNMAVVGITTAAITFSGWNGSNLDLNEEYDGTCWSEGNDLNTARRVTASAGNSTAALCIGGYPLTVNVESWNGTSWTETSTDINTAKMGMNGKGTSTETMIAGGESSDQLTETELFNGTTWTEVGDMAVKNYSMGALGGTNTAMLACGGSEGAPQGATNLVEDWSDPVYTIKTVTVS